MDRNEKASRLKRMLKQVSEDGIIESLVPSLESGIGGLESVNTGVGDQLLEDSLRGVLKASREQELSDAELFGLEAIVLPRERPVLFIQNDSYGDLPAPWTHFASDNVRPKIEAAIPSVGRIELPDSPWIPYGGTGFVVGDNLLMTNRHVGELFATGLGIKNLTFRPGQSAAIDFKREAGSDASVNLRVKEIVMIHPYWDMAILRVDGLPAQHSKLTLSVLSPDVLEGKDIAVIGYPARDERNDLTLQDRIFQSVYNVKRLHPGRIRSREAINSFGNLVKAMTHDSSTLGGNSGSAVIDVSTGHVVGLHFAGIYLKANYCVPTYELARDSRVVAAGLNFTSSINSTDEWLSSWRIADPESLAGLAASGQPAVPTSKTDNRVMPGGMQFPATGQMNQQSLSFTIPLKISVSLGTNTSPQIPSSVSNIHAIEGLKEPFIAGRLNQRSGYQPGFLKLDNEEEVPLPALTAAGKRMAAKLDDGSVELKYAASHFTRQQMLIGKKNRD
jgi:endonuclease G, mitochondrial